MSATALPLPLPNDAYDAPWKGALFQFFPEFLAFYFPDVHATVDWTHMPEFLNKELQQVAQDSELGKRLADHLVRLHTLGGGERWVLVHIEVQARRDSRLAERIFVYQYRIYDRYRRPVASLAILADSSKRWRPHLFGYQTFRGCDIRLRFRIAKLKDYADQMEELLEQDNPFALLTAAHLLTQQTKHQPQQRHAAKWRLTRMLVERDWDRQRVINLFHIIDWIMWLPKELEDRLWQDIIVIQGRQNMENYIPRGARIQLEREFLQAQERGLEEGRQLGLEQGLEKGLMQGLGKGLQQGLQQGRQEGQAALLTLQLTQRFGALPTEVADRVAAASPSQLQSWAAAILDARTLDEVVPRH